MSRPVLRTVLRPGRSLLPPLLAALLLALLAGCVTLPREGSVQAGPDEEQAEESDAPFDFRPSGPRPGAEPVDVVDGFLLAMQASPATTAVARQFLTAEGASQWVPERSTVIYGSQLLTESPRTVTTELEEVVELDGRGKWLGDTTDGEGLRFELEMVREQGEWRINNPPDALIIPESHFEVRYQQFFLHFFDQSAQILVPEPVYLPRGEQAPTLLVRRLLRGPAPALVGVERSFLPRGTELQLSVPVSPGGTAEVPLSREILELGREDLEKALAQLGWTLQQVSGIDRMRVTVDGSPLDLPGSGEGEDIRARSEYDPSIHWASQELFGLRKGRVVVVEDERETPVPGPLGGEGEKLRSVAVDFPAERVAAVPAAGTSVVVAPRGPRPDGKQADGTTVYSGTDVLQPGWDIYGHVWVADRTGRGTRLVVVRNPGVSTAPSAPGIVGEDVTSFAVSRDGTRFVAVVAGKRRDRLVVARVRRGREGQVRGLTEAQEIPLAGVSARRIRDVAWRSPGSLAVLTEPNEESSQVAVALVDGSPTLGGLGTNAQVFQQPARRVVTTPTPGTPLYVGTAKGQLFELAADGQWIGTDIEAGLRSATYVG
jgi:hypothetical protein